MATDIFMRIDTKHGRVRSEFADESDFAEVLAQFLGALVEKRAGLKKLLRAGDLEGLREAAHQLKGSGKGYGFPGLSECAAQLEASCRGGCLDEVAASLTALTDYLDSITA